MSRATLILGSMVVSLVLTAVLAWQAFGAAARHRALAEGVLRDYAALAADEYIRRTANHVGYNGYAPLLRSLGDWAQSQDDLPTREELARGLNPRAARAPELVRSLFLLPTGEPDKARFDGVDPAVQTWLVEMAARPDVEVPEVGRGLPVLHREVAGENRTFVFASLPAPRRAIVGFEVERAALEDWFAAPLEGAPLLPPSLTRDRAADARVTVSVVDVDGVQIFRSGEPGEYALAAYRDFGDTYGGVLDGSRVIATLDPEAAQQLVIGGLPATRLPLMFGLILLTLGLLLSAILLLRRERTLTRLRSEFVSRVSHELRTPLTQIRMFAETLLLDRVRSDDERRRSLVIIDRESRRLTHLVENILQFSRGERGATRLAPHPQELASLIREVVDEFAQLVGATSRVDVGGTAPAVAAAAPAARVEPDARVEPAGGDGTDGERHGVELVTRLESVVVPVDEGALRQVLLNLLDNAVKYGPTRQRIEIEATREGRAVRILVDDEGPGVPVRDRERIWRRFRRLDRKQENANAGTGIGLAVVRELIGLHGGKTWVEDGRRGGSRFVVELPLPAASPDASTSRAESEASPAGDAPRPAGAEGR